MPNLPVGDALFANNEWIETVELHKKGAVENEGGYAVQADPEPVEMEAMVRPDSASSFTRSRSGAYDEVEYIMLVRNEDVSKVSNGDAVKHRGEMYEVQETEIALVNDIGSFKLSQVGE